MAVKADQARVKDLITETITLLCKNGLHFKSEFCIQALIGITLDRTEVFLVNINETIATTDDEKRNGDDDDRYVVAEHDDDGPDRDKNKIKINGRIERRSFSKQRISSSSPDTSIAAAWQGNYSSGYLDRPACSTDLPGFKDGVDRPVDTPLPSNATRRPTTRGSNVRTTNVQKYPKREDVEIIDDEAEVGFLGYETVTDYESRRRSFGEVVEPNQEAANRRERLRAIGDDPCQEDFQTVIRIKEEREESEYETAETTDYHDRVLSIYGGAIDLLREQILETDVPASPPGGGGGGRPPAINRLQTSPQKDFRNQNIQNKPVHRNARNLITGHVPTRAGHRKQMRAVGGARSGHHVPVQWRLLDGPVYRMPRNHICDECGKAFEKRRDLRGHLAAKHAMQKEYRCDVCGKEFSYKRSLTDHASVHNHTRPVDFDLAFPSY